MRTAAIRAASLALALGIVSGAGASAASPEPGTLGLALTPAPVRVDDGARTVTAWNLSGGIALAVELTPSAGYAVEPATFTIAPGASYEVAVTAVHPERDGTLGAVAVAVDAPAGIRSAINLQTRFVHTTWIERHGGALAFGLLLAVLAAVVALWAVRRIREGRTT